MKLTHQHCVHMWEKIGHMLILNLFTKAGAQKKELSWKSSNNNLSSRGIFKGKDKALTFATNKNTRKPHPQNTRNTTTRKNLPQNTRKRKSINNPTIIISHTYRKRLNTLQNEFDERLKKKRVIKPSDSGALDSQKCDFC